MYFGLSKRHPLATINVKQLNILALNSYLVNRFWTGHYTIQITVICLEEEENKIEADLSTACLKNILGALQNPTGEPILKRSAYKTEVR